MKEYDMTAIGTGSAMGFVSPIADKNPDMKIAVIDKDEPGGICLTRACVPSKLLIYPADLVRLVESAGKFGIDVELKRVDFKRIMERMRNTISADIENIREGLSGSPNIDYYREVAEFIAPYTMNAGNETITSKMIFLGTGSKPMIPPVKGLDDVDYQTSDTLLKMTGLPESMAIMGGGFISAECSSYQAGYAYSSCTERGCREGVRFTDAASTLQSCSGGEPALKRCDEPKNRVTSAIRCN